MLGPLEVRSGGRPIEIGRGKPRALLALLALNAGKPMPAERLIDELWDDAPPATAATALQVYVSKLRKALGEGAIRTIAGGYVLAGGDVDLDRFRELVAEAARAEPPLAVRLLDEALALFRGPPLADVELPLEAARLEELRVAARERRCAAALALGGGDDLVPELEALAAEHPLRESFRAQLMLALYRAGRQADALAAYRDARQRLVDELGIEPSPRLQELEQAILRQDPTLAGAPARSVAATVVFLDVGVLGEVEAIAGRALAVATEALARDAVRVERGIADALLAVFDDADAAVGAAAEAVGALRATFGDDVAPRAGVSTGDVTIGERVTGAAVVLAARRVRAARTGEVVVGERSAAAARAHVFRLRGDALVLRGLSP